MARFSEADGPEAPPALPAEIEAALALGRLDGALGACRSATLRLFAAAQLRGMLIAALRQEGHAFTEQRFHAWFAGLVTLADEPPRSGRPPRVLVEAILVEMTHSSWEPLASLAARLLPALLAPSDLDADEAHEEAHTVVTAARRLIAAPEQDWSALPFPALASLHRAVSQDVIFAPAEGASEPITLGTRRMTIERTRPPSPRWAIELIWGEQWRSAGILRCALPWPGLIRLDVSHDDIEPTDARILIATNLRDCAQVLSGQLTEADLRSSRVADQPPGRRTTSRAPALYELLAGFGALRGSQIERLLGATRLGVRTILATLDAVGVLDVRTIAGVRLYGVAPAAPSLQDQFAPTAGLALSSEAIDDYNASMAHIEQLLARSDADLDDTED